MILLQKRIVPKKMSNFAIPKRLYCYIKHIKYDIMTKKSLVAFFLILFSVVSMKAQRFQVIDADGDPVPYATVTTVQGKLIGTTDIDGVFENTTENKVLCLSQVAYKPLTVNLAEISDGLVTMEDADYVLPDVVVKPKELLYVQTYYRVTYIDEEGPLYYRAGIIDNTYEFAKQKIDIKEKSISAAESGMLKFALNTLVGGVIKDRCKLQNKSLYQKVNSDEGKWAKVSVTTDSSGKQVISDSVSVLGYIDEDKESGMRTVSFNEWLFHKHLAIANEHNEKKKEKKQAELDEKEQNSEHSYFEVYRMNEEGNSLISDFVMQQSLDIGEFKRTKKRYILIIESFATETAYIDKKEFKQTRKDNDVDKSYEEMLRYEKLHNIPPLAPNMR